MTRSAFCISAALAALIALPAAVSAQEESSLGWAMGPAMVGMDQDGNGAFDGSELGGSRLPETFDLNGDGALDMGELSVGFFALHDENDDGRLDSDELRTMRGIAGAGVYRLDL